jgi:hypothetical protein
MKRAAAGESKSTLAWLILLAPLAAIGGVRATTVPPALLRAAEELQQDSGEAKPPEPALALDTFCMERFLRPLSQAPPPAS